MRLSVEFIWSLIFPKAPRIVSSTEFIALPTPSPKVPYFKALRAVNLLNSDSMVFNYSNISIFQASRLFEWATIEALVKAIAKAVEQKRKINLNCWSFLGYFIHSTGHWSS